MGRILRGSQIIRWLNADPASFDATPAEMSPEIGEFCIARNRKNRPLTPSKARLYGLNMSEGRFPATSSSIGFDMDGDMTNGQHRCHGCFLSGVSFLTVITKGLDPRSFLYEDIHLKRSLADVLMILGEQHYKLLAGALSWVARYRKQEEGSRTAFGRQSPVKTVTSKGASRTHDEMMELLDQSPSLRESVARFHKVGRQQLLTPSIIAAMHFLGCEVDRAITETFFDKFITGIGIMEAEPVGALIGLLKGASRLRPISNDLRFIYTLKALRFTLDGMPCKQLKWSSGETFPFLQKPDPAQEPRNGRDGRLRLA